jgi:hypothetical protein
MVWLGIYVWRDRMGQRLQAVQKHLSCTHYRNLFNCYSGHCIWDWCVVPGTAPLPLPPISQRHTFQVTVLHCSGDLLQTSNILVHRGDSPAFQSQSDERNINPNSIMLMKRSQRTNSCSFSAEYNQLTTPSVERINGTL